jgi:SAM-dependent methyltransferase
MSGLLSRGRSGLMGNDSYQRLAAEYDGLLGDLAEATWRAGILAELPRLQDRPGGLVVDLGAGTGIGGRLIGGSGWRYARVGVDCSAGMLRNAAGCYEAAIVADITAVPVAGSRAGLVVSGFDTLNYLSPARLQLCLGRVAWCLEPGGCLVFDYSSPALLRGRWRDWQHDQQLPDGVLRWRSRYDDTADRSVTVIERLGAASDVAWRETHVQYAVGARQMREAAAAAGLRVERARDLDRPGFSAKAATHVWVLRKDPGE